MMKKFLFLALILSVGVTDMFSQINARLFRYPDVSESHIVFSYGGDLWIVDKSGGNATKLSSPAGPELYPRFSPDGKHVAFTGNYDGNMDVYVVPVTGGIPKRLTHHGMMDRMLDWTPDGKSILFASSRESGKQRFSQMYKVSVEGGLAEKLPMAYGEHISLSPNGKMAAFNDKSRINRTWKRYRGGMNADIFLFNLENMESENITNSDANEEIPMWHGDDVYYLSDGGANQRFNIWKYDTKTKSSSQITRYVNYDVHFPAIGNKEIVYEAEGKLFLMNMDSGNSNEVNVNVVTDMMSLKSKKESVESYVSSMDISPDGNRATVEARGDIFSIPAGKGYVQNLTRSSGVAERYPAWSPNGKYIAYWSDKSGEYELTLRDLTEGAKEKKITDLGPGFRYSISWSPDSKKVVFVDQTMTYYMYTLETNSLDKIGQANNLFEGGLQGWDVSWSKDSKWLSYSEALDNGNDAIFIYNTKTKSPKQVTSGFYSDSDPVFDPTGQYLYMLTNRSFNPVYSDFDNSWTYPNATQLGVITLRNDVMSPLYAENDTVAIVAVDEEEEGDKDKKEDKGDDESDAEEDDEVKIDFDHFEKRLVILPPKAGNMGNLAAVEGKVLFSRYPNSGSAEEKSKLQIFNLEDREEETVMEGVGGYALSANGNKLLVIKNGQFGIVDVAPGQKMEKTLALGEMESTTNPMEEWQQIFNDAWRFQRDFFYDKSMHGVDWDGMKKQYGDMIQHCITRDDVNFVLGELIGELNASHAYRGGGDNESSKRRAVGYLGIDWERKGSHFAVKEIIRGAEWDNEVRSPLDEPGINVKKGDYILAVNGIALNEFPEPHAAFEGLAGKTVELTINSNAGWEGSRKIVVKTMRNETRLRNLAWIEQNRKRVDEASGGKIGYIYVPSTGVDGQNELVRQFYGQWNKEGLIVDERFNNGGQIPDRFIELLNRKPLAYWDVRDGKNWQWPPVGNFGSMAMLINGWSGSGGDAFPDYFKKANLGPVIGSRTWGGLIGISGAPQLIDGGTVTVPTFRMYNPDGTWFMEGHGVEPDIEVKEDPTALAKGIDPQIEKAIQEVMKSIEARGPIHPKTPAKEDRSRKGKT